MDDKGIHAGERLKSILPPELRKELMAMIREILTREAERRLGLTGQ
jgi:hypothetical protein